MKSAELRRDDSYLIDSYRGAGWVAFIAVADIDAVMFLQELAEMRRWCADRYGENADRGASDWTTFNINSRWYSRHRLFLFHSISDAIEFKMTWA
ncbi:MAG: hypothetical protein EOO77_29090 [Oxalobacteraceae bacterium]|nr:MAG: hypothetical protein EOO77_29090 [Oxalobacteraceae bacterium]